MAKSLNDQGKVQRQNQIKRLLSHTSEDSALSITEIANRLKSEGFSTARKTIERDIQDISRAYPLSETDANPTRYFFDGDFKLDFELIFDENQLQTIILALQSLKQMSPSVLKSLCLDVVTTLVSKLPKALGKEFEHLKSISNVSPTVLGEGDDIDSEVLQTVLLSLRKGKVFECEYYSPENKNPSDRKRAFAPLKLHFVGTPYLYVYDCHDDMVKLLRISRIKNAVMKSETVNAKRGDEIRLEHVFGGYGKGSEKIINYSIICTKPMAIRFKEHKIHPSQKIEVLKNDQFRITFVVHDSHEVIRLLAQYGEYIKSIEPESAYNMVKEIWKKGLGAA